MQPSAPVTVPARSYETLVTDLIDPAFTIQEALGIVAVRVQQAAPNALDAYVNLALTARQGGWNAVRQGIADIDEEGTNFPLITDIALICINNHQTTPEELLAEFNPYSITRDQCILTQPPEPVPNLGLLTPDKQIEFLVYCLNQINNNNDDEEISDPKNLQLIAHLPAIWQRRHQQSLPVQVLPGLLDPFTKACIRYPVALFRNCAQEEGHLQNMVRGIQNYQTNLTQLPPERFNLELLEEIGHLYSFGVQAQIIPPQGLHQFCPDFFIRFMRAVLHHPRDTDILVIHRQFCHTFLANTKIDLPSCQQVNLLSHFVGALVDHLDNSGFPLEHLPHLLINFQFLTEGLTAEERGIVIEVITGMVALASKDAGIDLTPIFQIMEQHPQKDTKILAYLTLYFASPNCHRDAQLDLFYEFLFEPGILNLVGNHSTLYQRLREHYLGPIANYWARSPTTEEYRAKDAILSQFFPRSS